MGWLEKLLGGKRDPRQRQAEALNKKAIESMARGNLDQAEKLLLQAVQMSPDMAAAHHNLGVVYLNQKRVSLALKHARRAVRLDPGDLESQIAVAKILAEMGKKEEALAEYRHLCGEFPEDWRSHISLGNALLEQDQREESIAHLEKAVQLAPRQELTHLMLATALERHGDLERAIREYRAVRNMTRVAQNRSAASAKMKELQQRRKGGENGGQVKGDGG